MLHIFLFARLCRSGSLYAEAKYAAMECNVKKAQKRTQFDKVVAKTKLSAQLFSLHTHTQELDRPGRFLCADSRDSATIGTTDGSCCLESVQSTDVPQLQHKNH